MVHEFVATYRCAFDEEYREHEFTVVGDVPFRWRAEPHVFFPDDGNRYEVGRAYRLRWGKGNPVVLGEVEPSFYHGSGI